MIRIELATGYGLDAPLKLLGSFLREGEPLPPEFLNGLRASIEKGDYEVLVAYENADEVGVSVLSYRLSISAGDRFVSIEELYVRSQDRRQGVGRALLEAVAGRCADRGVSYVEVQAVGEEAQAFYAAMGYERGEGVAVMSRSYTL